jgi:hypothetical protein
LEKADSKCLASPGQTNKRQMNEAERLKLEKELQEKARQYIRRLNEEGKCATVDNAKRLYDLTVG